MSKHSRATQRKLDEIETEFRALLLTCLRECAQGHWGLFGQNDHIDLKRKQDYWPKAKRLRDLAHEIHSLRLDFGQPNQTCEHFLRLCSLRGSNVPGEPKLAVAFLEEIDQS